MRDYKRKKKLIDFKTQSIIALEIMLHALILPIFIIVFLVVDPFSTLFSNRGAETHLRVAIELLKINAPKWPLLLLALLFIGVLSVIFSHHIAGPAFRFCKTFRAILEKDLTQRIKLRKWDYMKDVSQDFNMTLDNLNEELKTINVSVQGISKLAESAIKSKPDAKKDFDQILTHSRKIEEIVTRYKLL